MDAKLTEILRLLQNVVRVGVVSELDHKSQTCRIKTGELQTAWVPWLTARAGSARSWWSPTVGEQVLLLSIGGNLETSFALPGIYCDKNPAPSDSPSAHVISYPDGCHIEYNPETGSYVIKGAQSVTIEAAQQTKINTSSLEITAQEISVTGSVTITGSVEQSGGQMKSNGVVVDSHAHTGVQSGGSVSGGPQK